jgi:hypothetical protein
MKLKLIQGGGFLGKAKYAEEELSSHPEIVQEHLNELFSKSQNQPPSEQAAGSRDAFQYFVEYQGNRIPIGDKVTLTPEINDIVNKLKGELHY